MGNTVCVSGINAAGKTTFIKKCLNWFEEKQVSCYFMPEMFTDSVRLMVKTNLPVEDSFMFAHRLQMAIDAPEIAKSYDLVMMERSFIDHLAFVEAFEQCGHLTREQLVWSHQVSKEVAPPKPDNYIFLDISPELAHKRRMQRGSDGKGVFNLEFLQALKHAYNRLIPQYYDQPMIFDWSQFGEENSFDVLMEELFSKNIFTDKSSIC